MIFQASVAILSCGHNGQKSNIPQGEPEKDFTLKIIIIIIIIIKKKMSGVSG